MSMCMNLLAYAAVKLAEEQQQRRLVEVKREEENMMKRIFILVPRKRRSSLMKRRRTQQNPSRSLLPDLNLIPTDDVSETEENPQNPSSHDEPVMVCECDEEEEQRRKKGKSKIVFDDDYDDDDYETKRPLKKRFVIRIRRFPQESFHGEASTSSSFRYSEPEKTETTDTPPNPNYYHSSSSSSCLTTDDNTSRKRRALKQRKRTNGFKRAKISSLPRLVVTEPPEWIFKVMRKMNADAEIPMLILERQLFVSDVNSGQSRLLIPFQQLFRNDFLTSAECQAMKKEEDNEDDDENIGVGTLLVNHWYENDQIKYDMWGLRFKIWPMEKGSGKGTLNYALNWGWNDVVMGNDLKAGDKIRLWIFRYRGVLCFALDTK